MTNNINENTFENKNNTIVTNKIIVSPFKSKEELFKLYEEFEKEFNENTKKNHNLSAIISAHQMAIIKTILLSLK